MATKTVNNKTVKKAVRGGKPALAGNRAMNNERSTSAPSVKMSSKRKKK